MKMGACGTEPSQRMIKAENLPRNVVKNPATGIKKSWLKGISEVIPHKVIAYFSDKKWLGTFYKEAESLHLYRDEKFLRIVMFDDDSKDIETRIPLALLEKAGFELTPFSKSEPNERMVEMWELV
jgi:hypothetical protein